VKFGNTPHSHLYFVLMLSNMVAPPDVFDHLTVTRALKERIFTEIYWLPPVT